MVSPSSSRGRSPNSQSNEDDLAIGDIGINAPAVPHEGDVSSEFGHVAVRRRASPSLAAELDRPDSKSAAPPQSRIAETAHLLFRCGLESFGDFSATDEHARKYLFHDLRKTEHLNFLRISLLVLISGHIPPNGQKVPGGDMRYTEIDIPRGLATYRPISLT